MKGKKTKKDNLYTGPLTLLAFYVVQSKPSLVRLIIDLYGVWHQQESSVLTHQIQK